MVQIPDSHVYLIEGTYCVALTTVMPDGQPQTTPVWCNREGDHVLINSMRHFLKTKNMQVNPKVNIMAFDPKDPFRNMEMRGMVVEMSEEGALEHLDELTQLYLGKPGAKFFGDSVPVKLQSTHVPVRVKIALTRVRVEG